jgi:hypothetical protein
LLKTNQDGKLWMVTQPDHSQIAGFIAAHWGNALFTRPGFFSAETVADPERLRAEVILAIAEHDNGWWEWEAIPDLSVADGFPAGLGEALQNQQAGIDRWRRGLTRFPSRPFVNLLISSHAYWFYAARALQTPEPAFNHPLFWKGAPEKLCPESNEALLAFMAELQKQQLGSIEELRADPETASWVEPASLAPLQRLIQLCDGISLALCSALIPSKTGASKGLGDDSYELHDVPRRSWMDRCTITVTPRGDRRIELNPYPFDIDPLPVVVRARIVELPAERPAHVHSWWHACVPQHIQFQFVSAK